MQLRKIQACIPRKSRYAYGGRREAYTCWSTASGARINNYGTRIDLILAAGPDGAAASADFHGLFTAADVWMDAQGSDHAPAWTELAPHARILVGDIPPPLSSRYLFTGLSQLTSPQTSCRPRIEAP